MKNKPLYRICYILIFLLYASFSAIGQGGSKLVLNLGLPLHEQPMGEAELQLKRYWVFDSAVSNNGLGVGCEFNFGTNNSGITFGLKAFYQVDIYLGTSGKKRKSSIYVLARGSVIRYTNTTGNDYRLAPEAGISLFDRVSLLYGYNFPVPFDGKNEIRGVFNSRLTLFVTIGGKKK